jgi:NADP-dependent 3-hydroxy acid dehydrogenase YdfG
LRQWKKDVLMSGIEGKVVAITGASSGIGEATALQLAGRGGEVVLGAPNGSARGARRAHRQSRRSGRLCLHGREAARRSPRLGCGGVRAFRPVRRSRQQCRRRAGAKNAVRTISEGLRQEAGANLRVTTVSPGFVHTDFAESMTNPDVKAEIVATRDKMAIPPDAIARAIAFAIEQPPDVDIGEIVIRPTAQG